jgi:hypothetical protein
VVGLPILTRKDICSREVSRMANLFTNQKEIKRAIKAAVDQYEIYRNNTLAKHKRGRKNRAQNKRSKLRGNSQRVA